MSAELGERMFTADLAFNWMDALQKKTIKNITHIDFLGKYRNVRIGIDQCVLILQGLRYATREFFIIRVRGALYEPFAGPHYVQIGDEPPFWVHSLTAFRREFFGITDKLSFERSVFVGLSDGEVVRLKIARPYLFMPHGITLMEGALLKIMKTPTTHFYIGPRAMVKHIEEVRVKKAAAAEMKDAVRKRVRRHLVGTVEQLFCSYMRDTHIDHESALAWFRADMQYALTTCDTLYNHMARVRPEYDDMDHFLVGPTDGPSRPGIVHTTAAAEHVMPQLRERMSRVDPAINEALRVARERVAIVRSEPAAVAMSPSAQPSALERIAMEHMAAYAYMAPPPAKDVRDNYGEELLMAAYEEDMEAYEKD